MLDKAARSIRVAQVLLGEDPGFAVGRAYYAMFYCVEALLSERELHFRRHSAVHAAFGQQFAKTGVLNADLHRWLLETFAQRNGADYGVNDVLSDEDAQTAIQRASELLRQSRSYLEPESP